MGSCYKKWIECLNKEAVENILLIPSGVVQVEVLSAIVSSIASTMRADAVIDVGAGQVAQVHAFEYQHSVVAVDACSHHGKVTDARAERIKKHYSAQMRKFGSGNKRLNVPQTITCRIMSLKKVKALTTLLPHKGDVDHLEQLSWTGNGSSLVLARLHACGDLSVTMLKRVSKYACKLFFSLSFPF